MSLEQLKDRVAKLEAKDDGDIKLFFASWNDCDEEATGGKRRKVCRCLGGPAIVQHDDETEDAFIARARAECMERYRTAGKKGLQAVWLEEIDLAC